MSTSLPTLNIDFAHHSTPSPHQQQDLLTLLHDYINLFASDHDADPLGCTAVTIHAMNTEGLHIYQPMQCQPVALQNAIDSEIQKMLGQSYSG